MKIENFKSTNEGAAQTSQKSLKLLIGILFALILAMTFITGSLWLKDNAQQEDIDLLKRDLRDISYTLDDLSFELSSLDSDISEQERCIEAIVDFAEGYEDSIYFC